MERVLILLDTKLGSGGKTKGVGGFFKFFSLVVMKQPLKSNGNLNYSPRNQMSEKRYLSIQARSSFYHVIQYT